MFDIGWIEMMVIIIVMIIVIGPKDLPRVLRAVGQWVARAREVARNFQDSIEDMANQAGLDEVRKNVNTIRDFDVKGEVEKAIDPKGELSGKDGEESPKPAQAATARPADAFEDDDYYDEDDDYGDYDEGDEDRPYAAPTWERNRRLAPTRPVKRRRPGAVNRIKGKARFDVARRLKAHRARRPGRER